MTAQGILQRSEPLFRLTVEADGSRERVELGTRLIGFTFEDSDHKTDKASLQLDNFDLSFFDSKLVVKGALLELSWGYPGHMSPVRTLVVRRVQGFIVLQVEAHAKSVLLHREQRCRSFEHVTRSAIARQIAREHGFDPAFVHIEDTSEVYACANQAGETDARFLARLAAREGFRFYVDETGFHWRSRRFDQAPVRAYRYYTDPGQGDILDIRIDSDALAKPGRVDVHARDPKQRKTITAAGSDAETKRDTLGGLVEVVDPETGRTVLEQRNAAASVHASAAAGAGRAKREADARFRTSSQESVKLTMRAVGDPAQSAKCVIEIQGISGLLSGKYYVKSAKHVFGAGGYTMELSCIKDATGRLDGGRASAAKPNLAAAKDPNELRPIELVDPETGRTELAYRRE
jgi:phage protein D